MQIIFHGKVMSVNPTKLLRQHKPTVKGIVIVSLIGQFHSDTVKQRRLRDDTLNETK